MADDPARDRGLAPGRRSSRACSAFIDGDDTIEAGEAISSFLFALGGAVVLLILYRKFVQKRPITGPPISRQR